MNVQSPRALLSALLITGGVLLTSPAQAVVRCVVPAEDTTPGCFRGAAGLQQAFNAAQSGDVVAIAPGVYDHTASAGLDVQMIDRYCHDLPAGTQTASSFRIANKTNVTVRSSTGNPTDVVLLGGWPHVHALSIVSSTNVRIENISIFTNGNLAGNFLGDAALNVVSSTGSVTGSILSANKTTSGPHANPWLLAAQPGELDSEGIVLYGSATNFTVESNLITNNFHTGIMMLNGATGVIRRNYIARNGHDVGNDGKGHGLTTFHFSEVTTCYNGNMKLDMRHNVVADNSGIGALIRGVFTGSNQLKISHNTFYGNDAGIRIGPSNWDVNGEVIGGVLKVDETEFKNTSSLLLVNNMIEANTYSGVKVVDPPTTSPRKGGLKLTSTTSPVLWITNNSSFKNKPNADYTFPTTGNYLDEYNHCTATSVCPTCIENCYSPITSPKRDTYFRLQSGSPLENGGYPCPYDPFGVCPDLSSYDTATSGEPVFSAATLAQLCTSYPTAVAWLGTMPSTQRPKCTH